MIAIAVEEEIRRLLDETEWSQRKIARNLGVSRGTVNAIARGKRPNYAARRQAPSEPFTIPSGLARRCPICGAKVQMPCLACQVRAWKKEHPNKG